MYVTLNSNGVIINVEHAQMRKCHGKHLWLYIQMDTY